jgi:hypothetical protein
MNGTRPRDAGQQLLSLTPIETCTIPDKDR